jgi:hypothetical protein
MTDRIGKHRRVLKEILNKGKTLNILTEVSVLALTICSWITSYIGALQLVNSDKLVALLFAVGIQGMMLVLAHTAARSTTTNHERANPLKLLLGWALCACFSIYTSALGAYQLQMGSVNSEHERQTVQQKWEAAANELSHFRTNALIWLGEKSRDLNTQISVEKKRIQAARANRRPYSNETLVQLTAQDKSIEAAKGVVGQVVQLSNSIPKSPEDARQEMDKAYASAAEAFSAMPAELRLSNPLPHPTPEPMLSEDRQTSFFAELKQKSAPAVVALVVAFLLDVIPLYIIWAHKPSRSLADRIRGFRVSSKATLAALKEDLKLHKHQLRVIVDGYDIESVINFGAAARVLYLNDLEDNFDQFERMLGDVVGHRVRIVSAKTVTGTEIVHSIPLISQLEGDVIRLSVEPVEPTQEVIM